MSATKFEYRGVKVVIGQSTYTKLWRASLDGFEIPNTFFKTFGEADTHCKAIIDARNDDEARAQDLIDNEGRVSYAPTKAAHVHLLNQYTLSLSGDAIHAVLTSLVDAERFYEKSGFDGLAENAKQAHKAIISQLPQTI